MLNKNKIQKILSNKIKEIYPNEIPHFSKLKNIQKGTDRIIKGIKNKEKIVLVGDYDVDGVVSSTIIYQFFKKLNYPIKIIIPDRFEDGYGLTPNILNKIDNCDILITVDNGISSYEAANICKTRKIDLIITDHHTPTYPLPEAFTIINPKQKGETFPFSEICGAEVAWYLCASINKSLNLNVDMREFLDYLVLAIIADVMPLQTINRILVKMGLAKLSKSNKPFALILKKFFNTKYFYSEDIAFNIAPRLNSAGRMEHAMISFNFLNASDIDTAQKFFDKLDKTNTQRKETEQHITDIVSKKIKPSNYIISYGDFHEGVVGIVASRLVHKYQVPSFVFTQKNDILKGSARSLGDVDLYQLISKCSEFVEGFGGHKLACGLSIKKENIQNFISKIALETSKLSKELFFIDEFIMGELPLSECDFELIEILNRFEPFGQDNPKPKFKAIVNINSIKKLKDNHYKLIVSQNGIYKDGIIFRYDGQFDDKCEIVFSVTENNWNKNRNIQLMIEKINLI
jgi:single-stranded-DNA-specific exonuclease